MYLYKTANSSDLEELSTTDIDQPWGKLKSSVKEDYEATPIMEFCHVNEHLPVYSRGLPAIDDEQAAEFAKLIFKADKRSEIYHHKMLLREQASVKNCTLESERKEMEMKFKEAAAITTRILEKEPSAILQILKKKTEDKVKALSSELLQFYDETVKVGKEKLLILLVKQMNFGFRSDPLELQAVSVTACSLTVKTRNQNGTRYTKPFLNLHFLVLMLLCMDLCQSPLQGKPMNLRKKLK